MICTLEDIMHRDNQTVTDFTRDGKCSMCGECCGDMLPLSAREINRIKRYVKDHGIREHTNAVVAADFNFKCPFRDDARRKCDIYDVRPKICRSFMCNYDRQKISANKALFHQRYEVISIRSVFFRNPINEAYVLYAIDEMMKHARWKR